MIVTIYKNILETQTFYHREVDEVFERIKQGKSKDLVEQIRKLSDKSERNNLKKKLPSILFSGKFEKRSAKSIIQHSGLICLDFDQFPSDKEMEENRQKLQSDKYTFALFTSPSGDGLKLIVKIPADPENHKQYFEALKNYYDSQYFDIACSDVSRVCYESFDANIFVNKSSEIFTQKIEEEEKEYYKWDDVTVPITSQNEIITKLQKWWVKKHPMVEGLRNKNLFVLAIAFNEYGVTKDEAERFCYNYTTKDFTEREIDKIIDSAYKNTQSHGTKQFEDKKLHKKIERQVKTGATLKSLQKNFPQLSDEQIEEITKKIKTQLADVEFWTYDKEGKIEILPNRFKEFLEENGYFKFYSNNSTSYIFVKKHENIIENTSPEQMKDFVLTHLYNNEEFGNSPYNAIADNTKYFRDKYLDLIKSVNVVFKEDTKDTCYLYYNNSVLEISKDKINQIKYIDLDGFVWRNQIINREFEKVDYRDSDFNKFVYLISGQEEDKYFSICSIIGYLLHSHKTSANNRAIILNDETISENPNGGSGKGILSNAISKIKNVVFLDGKQFNFEKSFAYQTVQIDTQVLVFDDVKKNFEFERIFSLITEGITLEKKNKDAIKLPLKDSPKIMISTNYTIGGIGGSFERRKFEIELSSYFSANYTPLDEFGKMLFDEWDKKQWQMFDNFMISCIQLYLEKGLIKHEFKNLELRKFIKDTSFEFSEWVNENLPIGDKIYQADKFNEFTEEYSDYKKWLTKKKFKQWIDAFAKYLGKNSQDGRDLNGRFTTIC